MSTDVLCDRDLWQVMSRNDMSALGELFDRHADRVYRYLARSMPSPEDAEDALSDVFLEAWRSRRAFEVRGETALPIFLAIAHRITQKHYRTRSRRPVSNYLQLLEGDSVVPDFSQNFVDEQERKDQSLWLWTRVQNLEIKYRNVFEMAVYAELSQEEIASNLKLPIGTVKSRLNRAKKMIYPARPENSTMGLDKGAVK